MPYPPPPWQLLGHGVQTLHTVPIADVREGIPPELQVVSLWPGRTLGIVAFAHYGAGSTLPYDELIVASALCRQGARFGFWVSHIYVSHPDSVAGGREIWGVPKHLADFHWSEDRRVVSASRQGSRLCEMRTTAGWRLWRTTLRFPTYSRLHGDLLRFTGVAKAKMTLARGRIEVPEGSPFAGIRFSRALAAVRLTNLDLVCQTPSVVGQTAPVAMLPCGA